MSGQNTEATTPSRAVWERDFRLLATELKTRGYVFEVDGALYIRDDAPEGLTRPYRGLLSVGYVNGWLE